MDPGMHQGSVSGISLCNSANSRITRDCIWSMQSMCDATRSVPSRDLAARRNAVLSEHQRLFHATEYSIEQERDLEMSTRLTGSEELT
jgi:hypothetical protein